LACADLRVIAARTARASASASPLPFSRTVPRKIVRIVGPGTYQIVRIVGPGIYQPDPMEIVIRKRGRRATSFDLRMLVCDRCEGQEGAKPN
jgi:hypothetical protein